MQISEMKKQSTLSKIATVFGNDVVNILTLIIGFLVTYYVIFLINGSETMNIIFKGISIQVLLTTFLSFNISEMTLWIYFFILFLVILGINYLLRLYSTDKSQNAIAEKFGKLLKLFTEGSLILPIFLMLVFPFIVQTLLPTVIYGVLLIEMIVPFMLTGRIFKKSAENFKILISEVQISLKKLKFLIIALIYPLFIFFMIWSNIDVFYSLVHYNLLWDNPNSQIAAVLWGFLDQIVAFLEFGNSGLHDLMYHFIVFVNAFIVLTIFSIIYLICEDITSNSIRFVVRERLMPYN